MCTYNRMCTSFAITSPCVNKQGNICFHDVWHVQRNKQVEKKGTDSKEQTSLVTVKPITTFTCFTLGNTCDVLPVKTNRLKLPS